MEKQRRSFSEEFKREAVRRVEAREHTFSQIARELGINRSLLQLWRKRYGTQAPPKVSPPKPGESLEEENRRLRRENAGLREDREILKKAAAFFAKESR
jgi:transposase